VFECPKVYINEVPLSMILKCSENILDMDYNIGEVPDRQYSGKGFCSKWKEVPDVFMRDLNVEPEQ
jgi:hypothetical protein